jgi:hypothetical protein
VIVPWGCDEDLQNHFPCKHFGLKTTPGKRRGLSLGPRFVPVSFTLGDLAAKLWQICTALQREGFYDDGQTSDTMSWSGPKDTICGFRNNDARCVFLNRTLLALTEFVRVAVISPGSSAGLGDFRAEVDRLQSAGLCPAGRSTTTRRRPCGSSQRAAVT